MPDLFTHGRVDATDLEPYDPEDAGIVPIEGEHNARLRTFVDNEDVWAGVSDVDPCVFAYRVEQPTVVQLIDGEASVSVDGRKIDLTAGGIAFFSPGTDTRWTIKRRVRDLFIIFKSAEGTVAV